MKYLIDDIDCYKIIFVDGGSKDGTVKKAEELGWKAVILIGDLSYYGQFNFNISNFIEFPQPTNPNRILIRSLNNFRTDNIRGKARKWGMS